MGQNISDINPVTNNKDWIWIWKLNVFSELEMFSYKRGICNVRLQCNDACVKEFKEFVKVLQLNKKKLKASSF